MVESSQSKEELQLEQISGDAEFFQDTPAPNNRLLELTELLYEASNIEEPCARKPHAGICEGAVG